MKTTLIILILAPFLFHALKALYLYVAHFQDHKCTSCPFACSAGKKNFCRGCPVKPQK